MKLLNWDSEKNVLLKQERNISFEEIVFWISQGHVLDIVEHPNKSKYGHQRMMIVEVRDYAYLVPFVENDEEIFLKTIIPSRKATKQYLKS